MSVPIEDMVAKLMEEAAQEADHKAFCDEEVGKSRKAKDTKAMKMDQYRTRIDEAATKLQEGGDDVDPEKLRQDISEYVTKLFESCNFQDLTGQRITFVTQGYTFLQHVHRICEQLLRTSGAQVERQGRTPLQACELADIGKALIGVECQQSLFPTLGFACYRQVW